ncbi:MAG: 30S ribosomal protein S4 [Fibrobacterota bacterium]
MAVYRGPKCKLCRREKTKLFLKGERCYSEKCAFERRAFAPGQHGQSRRRGDSEYGLQLREKQKAKRIYGILEKQFLNYYKKANTEKGVTGENLLRKLETRFDNVVYRMGLAPSRTAARQLILHNHYLLNGKKANVPSIHVAVNDEIQVKPKSNKIEIIHAALKRSTGKPGVDWLEVDKVNLKGRLLEMPSRDQIPVDIQAQLIVELYSK